MTVPQILKMSLSSSTHLASCEPLTYLILSHIEGLMKTDVPVYCHWSLGLQVVLGATPSSSSAVSPDCACGILIVCGGWKEVDDTFSNSIMYNFII